ncbi:MAG: hypothetical protein FWG40_01120 [Peptococcaceae bacterium]|nr:hypothetical protein [Peptococcaceae bacterium]
MDIRAWLEDGTGLPAKDTRYLKSPQPPYTLFSDDITYRGADLSKRMVGHSITIQHWALETETEKEERITKFLLDESDRGLFSSFRKYREWANDEKMYVTYFELALFWEKVRE